MPRIFGDGHDCYKHLSAAILLKAALDAQDGDMEANLWLSSPAAALMFEALDMSDFDWHFGAKPPTARLDAAIRTR